MEQTEAILIGRSRYSETSLIVHWCSAESGLIRTIAKGALRPKSPMGSQLDLFVTVDLSWVRSRRSDLHTLRELKWRAPRLGLRASYGRVLAATHLARLITTYVEPESPVPELHALLSKGLDYLNEQDPSERLIQRFEWRLAQTLGVAGAEEEPGALLLEQAFQRKLPVQRRELMKWLASRSDEAAENSTL